MAIFIQFQTSMSSSEDQKGSARGYPGGTSSAHEKMRHMACVLAAPLQRVRSLHRPRHHLFSHLTLVIPPGVCLSRQLNIYRPPRPGCLVTAGYKNSSDTV